MTRRCWAIIASIGLGLVGAACGSSDGGGGGSASMVPVGTPISIEGGMMVVDAARELGDPMMAMHQGNQDGFAQSGMAMSKMSPDPIPDGMRRIRVDIRIVAEGRTIEVAAARFSIVDPFANAEPATARHSILGDGRLAANEMLNGLLEFDIPTTWTHPMLRLEGSGAEVHLELDPSADHAHHHTSDSP